MARWNEHPSDVGTNALRLLDEPPLGGWMDSVNSSDELAFGSLELTAVGRWNELTFGSLEQTSFGCRN